jgi:multiple sugar transport system substrate-binding protein
LTVLVVDDPGLGPAIARQWRAHTEEELQVQEVSADTVEKAGRLPGDVVVFPVGLLGTLAQRGLIQPLPPSLLESPQFEARDIFDAIRLMQMRWGQQTVAVPLGLPQLVLVYRADLLEKLDARPPADWADYQKLIARLADPASLGDAAAQADAPWHAAIEPLAAGWAGQLLLARAAAYALHREQFSALFRFETMEPLIDQPPYVRALEELVASSRSGGYAQRRDTPQQAMAALCQGQCALALTWPGPQTPAPKLPSGARIDFALLPGSDQAYRFATRSWQPRQAEETRHVPLLSIEGRLAAVCSSTRQVGRAQTLALWLAGPQASVQVGPHSPWTTLFRASHLASATRWTGELPPQAARRYAQVLQETLQLPRTLPGVTIPGRARYLAALDEAVWAALDGTPPRQALAAAAQRWEEITQELGREAQRRASAASLQQEAF